MTYQIIKTDGTVIYELPENTVDNEKTPVALIGKLTPDYGAYQSNNFVHVVEHFANNSFPTTPLRGMIVYRNDLKSAFICTDENIPTWVKIMAISFEGSDVPQTGDIWYDQVNKKLYVYDALIGTVGEWVLIGPENFFNKSTESFVVKTDSSGSGKASFIVTLEPEQSSLTTLKIVGKEYIDNFSEHPKKGQQPETMSAIVRIMTNSYKTTSNILQTSIIGNPSFEVIARTTGTAQDWTITPSIFETNLRIDLVGIGTPDLPSTARGWVDWTVDTETIRI